MHIALAPGERLLPGTREAAAGRFEDPRVEAVLIPLVPAGRGVLAEAARRYLRAWDGRFLHPQTCFAPAFRTAWRDAGPGPRAGDAAPRLMALLVEGARIDALGTGGVEADVAEDLGAWVRFAREEGAAWGRAVAADARLRPFLPATSRRGWRGHNVWHVGRRMGEALQAMRRPSPLGVALHVIREATWTAAALEASGET